MNIILIGFMAAGKTTVGQALAERLGMSFCDTDDEIVRMAGTETVDAALERYGEPCFREIEARACASLTGARPMVIATGGGVVENKKNIDVLRSLRPDSVVVWLSTSYAEARRRATRSSRERPLFADERKATDCFEKRQWIYHWAADVVVETDGLSVRRVAQTVINSIVERHLGTSKSIFAIVGNPVTYSLSPHMHRAGYAALGLRGTCLYRKKKVVDEDALKEVVDSLHAGKFRGLSSTYPWKEATLRLCDDVNEHARAIGAVNTLCFRSENIVGENTDFLGIVEPLKKRLGLSDAKIAVLGAGGAARAAVYGLVREGSEVIVFSRDEEKGRKVAHSFAASWEPWKAMDDLRYFDAIVNATPIGMGSLDDVSPVAYETLQPAQVVFDLVYHPVETPLLRFAKAKEAIPVSGLEMLLEQGARQFELFTGLPAPREAMRSVLPLSSSTNDL